MTPPFDLAIVGGGIVGLASAYRLLLARPAVKLVVLEKERELATHQTAHNSGVLHAGLYYPPGSLKARLCREGKAALERFAEERGIPCERRGKVVVAVEESELGRLSLLRARAAANGIDDIQEIGRERLREIEPHAEGSRALWSPSTAVIDFRQVARAFGEEVQARGGEIRTGAEVTRVEERPGEVVLHTPSGDAHARNLMSCAGLQSDRIAAMTGDGGPEKIVPFRGDYYRLTPSARPLVRGLIYPVPDPRFPFLGVHFTRRIDGEVLAGPNAVLAFAREGYRRLDFSARDLAEILAFRGFRRLARRHAATGLAELWRDWFRSAFARRLKRYVPEIRASDLEPAPSGVRAQALSADGSLVEDFAIRVRGRVLHVVNAPSPAATASLAIGRELADMAITRFGF